MTHGIASGQKPNYLAYIGKKLEIEKPISGYFPENVGNKRHKRALGIGAMGIYHFYKPRQTRRSFGGGIYRHFHSEGRAQGASQVCQTQLKSFVHKPLHLELT